jgi:hypothetical protein
MASTGNQTRASVMTAAASVVTVRLIDPSSLLSMGIAISRSSRA